MGSVDGGGGSDGQGQIRGAAGTGTTGRAPATGPGWQMGSAAVHHSARVTARARILLKSGDGWAAPQVAEALDVALSTVIPGQAALCRRRVGEGFAGPSPGQPAPEVGRPGRGPPNCPPVVAGGRLWPAAQRRKDMTTGPCACWPGRSVELGLASSMSHEGVRKRLKKTLSSRGRRRSGASPR